MADIEISETLPSTKEAIAGLRTALSKAKDVPRKTLDSLLDQVDNRLKSLEKTTLPAEAVAVQDELELLQGRLAAMVRADGPGFVEGLGQSADALGTTIKDTSIELGGKALGAAGEQLNETLTSVPNIARNEMNVAMNAYNEGTAESYGKLILRYAGITFLATQAIKWTKRIWSNLPDGFIGFLAKTAMVLGVPAAAIYGTNKLGSYMPAKPDETPADTESPGAADEPSPSDTPRADSYDEEPATEPVAATPPSAVPPAAERAAEVKPETAVRLSNIRNGEDMFGVQKNIDIGSSKVKIEIKGDAFVINEKPYAIKRNLGFFEKAALGTTEDKIPVTVTKAVWGKNGIDLTGYASYSKEGKPMQRPFENENLKSDKITEILQKGTGGAPNFKVGDFAFEIVRTV